MGSRFFIIDLGSKHLNLEELEEEEDKQEGKLKKGKHYFKKTKWIKKAITDNNKDSANG